MGLEPVFQRRTRDNMFHDSLPDTHRSAAPRLTTARALLLSSLPDTVLPSTVAPGIFTIHCLTPCRAPRRGNSSTPDGESASA
jgi:hypothetical protein